MGRGRECCRKRRASLPDFRGEFEGRTPAPGPGGGNCLYWIIPVDQRYVFGIPVGTLIATSGAFAIILGLALQSTLNDLFSGIALKLGHPYTVGDWIFLDAGTQGKLIETNWRSTHLVNSANDLVVIPNSALAKAIFINLSSPSHSHGKKLKVRVTLDKSPVTIEAVLRTALASSNLIAREPPTSTRVTGLSREVVEVELSFSVSSLSLSDAAQSEIFDLIYRHLKAAGLSLAPEPGEGSTGKGSRTTPEHHPSSAWRLLNAINLFAALTEDEKGALAASMTRLTFQQGSTIVERGTKMASLYIIRSGVAIVEGKDGSKHEDARKLSPGDFIGEVGVLMAAAERASIRAATFVVVYEISKERIAALLSDRPAIADELGTIVAKHTDLAANPTAGLRNAEHTATLSQKIRNLLHAEPPHGS
ncbi:mechanosensitive ion channel family protein [Mesorhizobium sp. M1409]|uniref:mechanosensitive ion channel family protein n=1 Tax=unclassified Mesorhizobium TaxID=325217 RepID=UPI00333749A1